MPPSLGRATYDGARHSELEGEAPVLELPRRVMRSRHTGRLSTQTLFVDPWRSEQRASIVLGTARSGTTKLAELLCSAGGARLLCEPLHTFYSPMVPSTFVWGQYLEPGARHDDLRALWSDCLSGRARQGWIDHFNQARIVRHRVVKEIAGTNLASWLRREFPRVGVVYVVRHPFAVARSLTWFDNEERRGADAAYGINRYPPSWVR